MILSQEDRKKAADEYMISKQVWLLMQMFFKEEMADEYIFNTLKSHRDEFLQYQILDKECDQDIRDERDITFGEVESMETGR